MTPLRFGCDFENKKFMQNDYCLLKEQKKWPIRPKSDRLIPQYGRIDFNIEVFSF